MLVGACALLSPRAARAQAQDPVALTWKAPPDCPTEDAVRSEALRLLAGPPIAADRRVVASAQVVHLATGRWRVEVSMSSATAEGRRSLEAGTCSGLANATALIVAIMVDPDRAGAAAAAPAASTTSPAPASPPPPVVQPPPAAAALPPSAPAPPPVDAPGSRPSPIGPPRWAAGAWALVDTSTLPSVAYGVGGGVAVLVWHLRADAAVGFLPPSTYGVSTESGVGAEMSLWAGSLDLAYVFSRGPLELALGAGAEAAHISAVGVALKEPVVGVPGSATWPALRAGGTLTAPIYKPIFLRLSAEAVAPLERPRFVIDPLGTVHQPSAVAARLGVGVELRF
jgi:hypothetical protein